MTDFIPLSVPSIKGNEWEYVKECLDTEWVSSAGKFVDRFEAEICKFTGAKHAVACINGTAALHIALQLVGVEAGDEVLVPTLTFIAPINAVRYVAAEPVFMDCDSYYNMDVDKVKEFLERETNYEHGETRNKRSGRRIAAIIPVHVFGNAVRMAELCTIAKEHGIKVIEDATESLGTRYKGCCEDKHTGTLGDIGCISFNGNKIITTGGGGMIITDNPDYASKARYLTTQAKDDEVRYVHHEVGYNYRLTNVQAAIGVAQLERLPEYLTIKRANFESYKKALTTQTGLTLAEPPPYAENNLWMYALQIDAGSYGLDRERLMAELAKQKIQTRPVWHLNHLQKPYLNRQAYRIEKAPALLAKTLNIPCSVNLTAAQVQRVIKYLVRQ